MKVVNLGEHYVSDFIKSEADYEGRKKYSLDLVLNEEIGAAQQCGVSIGTTQELMLQ